MIVPQNLEKTLRLPIPFAVWSIRTTSKARRKPGKSGPAASAFLDPEPPLRRLHQKNLSTSNTKIKTPCPTSRRIDSRAEGFVSRFLRSQPRRIGSGSSHRARPDGRASPYHEYSAAAMGGTEMGGTGIFYFAQHTNFLL